MTKYFVTYTYANVKNYFCCAFKTSDKTGYAIVDSITNKIAKEHSAKISEIEITGIFKF